MEIYSAPTLEGTNFDITKKDDGKIHIEQKAGSAEEYDYDRLTSDEVVKATNVFLPANPSCVCSQERKTSKRQ